MGLKSIVLRKGELAMSKIKVYVNEALEEIRKSMNLTEIDIQNDSERLFDIASQNKIGNKIMANVPLYLIYIDDSYQRTETFSLEKANGIAANFIEAAYDPIKLNYRDGRFYCPAGQHRIYAHIIMKRECIGSELFVGDKETEINIFLTQDDNRSKLTPYNRYKAGLEMGRETDVILHDVCEKYKVKICPYTNVEQPRLGSITTAKKYIETWKEKGISWIFDVMFESGWAEEENAFKSTLFRALGKVYSTCNGNEIMTKRLIEEMKKTSFHNSRIHAYYEHWNCSETAALGIWLSDIAKGKVKVKTA